MNHFSAELTGRRVLVVEDEPLIALDVENMLLSLGCVVAGSACSLDNAMSLAGTADIDAALLDIFLPDGRTFPVADVLAERGIPVIFLSAGNQCDIPEMYSHVTLVGKPFATGELKGSLQRALGQATHPHDHTPEDAPDQESSD